MRAKAPRLAGPDAAVHPAGEVVPGVDPAGAPAAALDWHAGAFPALAQVGMELVVLLGRRGWRPRW